jgi:hypothetical protein
LPARPGRGPVAAQPVLSAEHQHQFFNHLLSAADSKVATDMPVLRRQAISLLGFDQRSESADWLAAQHKRAFGGRKTEDPTSGIAARSAAVALARRATATHCDTSSGTRSAMNGMLRRASPTGPIGWVRSTNRTATTASSWPQASIAHGQASDWQITCLSI